MIGIAIMEACYARLEVDACSIFSRLADVERELEEARYDLREARSEADDLRNQMDEIRNLLEG
jgi:hypothetical protein